MFWTKAKENVSVNILYKNAINTLIEHTGNNIWCLTELFWGAGDSEGWSTQPTTNTTQDTHEGRRVAATTTGGHYSWTTATTVSYVYFMNNIYVATYCIIP